jgi:acyl carrier protein
LDDGLKVIDQWQPSTQLDRAIFPDLTGLMNLPNASVVVRERIERVLLTWLIRQAGADKQSIDAQRPFAECGIDSLMAVEMSGQLEQWLGIRLSPVVAWSHPNAEKLSEYLAEQLLGEKQELFDAPEQSVEMLLAEIESMSESEILEAMGDSD